MEQVDEASGNAMAEATTAVVEAILEPLRPAMVAMRAKVEVRLSSIAFYPVNIMRHEQTLLTNEHAHTIRFLTIVFSPLYMCGTGA